MAAGRSKGCQSTQPFMKPLTFILLVAMNNPLTPPDRRPAGLHSATLAATHSQAVVPPVSAETRVVTVVKSKAPWYAFDFLLAREFRKVVPKYQRVDGLLFKAFSSIITPQGKLFGGIYLWAAEAPARAWYTPTWFADVERRRGHRPEVSYYPLVQEASFVAPDFDYRAQGAPSVTVFAHGIGPAQGPAWLAAPAPGLLRAYLVDEGGGKQGALLLFAAAGPATQFVRGQHLSAFEWFKTPVLLRNAGPR